MLKEFAPAKINLGLKILYKRNDGYHELQTIMQQIGLKDVLYLAKNASPDIILHCYGLDLDEKDNLAYKAACKIKEQANIREGAVINLYKNIPSGAGLGGGSSDAAATLRGLNKLWNLNWHNRVLKDMGQELGADVPFCVQGGTVLAEGIGEKMTTLADMPFRGVVLARPPFLTVSTAQMYHGFACKGVAPTEVDFSDFVYALEQKDRLHLQDWLRQNNLNDLESVAREQYPQLNALQDAFREMHLTPLMSGSGPTIFSLVESVKSAMEKAAYLELRGYQAWASWTETSLDETS